AIEFAEGHKLDGVYTHSLQIRECIAKHIPVWIGEKISEQQFIHYEISLVGPREDLCGPVVRRRSCLHNAHNSRLPCGIRPEPGIMRGGNAAVVIWVENFFGIGITNPKGSINKVLKCVLGAWSEAG